MNKKILVAIVMVGLMIVGVVTYQTQERAAEQLPVDSTVPDTIDNAAKGNTATGATKEATLDTGFTLQVPMFIKTGDRVRILTEDGSYLERA